MKKLINWQRVKVWFQDWAATIISVCVVLLTAFVWFVSVYLILHS